MLNDSQELYKGVLNLHKCELNQVGQQSKCDQNERKDVTDMNVEPRDEPVPQYDNYTSCPQSNSWPINL